MRCIATFNFGYVLIFLLTINMYQFRHRKLVQYIFTILTLVYTMIETFYQGLNGIYIGGEFSIMMLLSMIVFKFITKHNSVVLIQRSIQVLFYLVMMVLISILNGKVRDTRDFYSTILYQYTTLLVKKISQVYLENRLRNNL